MSACNLMLAALSRRNMALYDFSERLDPAASAQNSLAPFMPSGMTLPLLERNAMPRRSKTLWFLTVLIGMMLLPTVALAAGSDTNKFAEYAAKSPALAVGAAFVFGVVASLTPCVFPMVPITVSIFGATEATSRTRGAALSAVFVLGIATLFTPMGIASALTGSVMGSALSKWYVVIPIAVLFAALASSMFGAFELALPSSLQNRLSTVGGVGFKGAFVLGLTMGLVAAPCTGPFMTGLILWIAQTQNVLLGTASMFAFALGLGMIFFVAGAFAVNLPKGGAWMQGIKWGSGVVLAYMALAQIRDRYPTVFKSVVSPSSTYGVIAFVLLLAGLVFGIVHVIAERRRSPIAHLSKPMKLASIIPAIAGMFMFLTWYAIPRVSMVPDAIAAEGKPVPPAIAWEKDEKTAIAKATADKKPVLIDFGAEWCKACKELDEFTWPDARVRAESSRYVSVKVDATDDENPETKRLSQKYKVVGLPTVILLDSEGKEAARFNEFVKPEAFIETFKSVK